MCSWIVKICVLVMFLNYSVCVLNPHSAGVCTVKVSVPRSRTKTVTYYTNKWCGKRKCIGRKKVRENYKVTTTQTICCNGWQYESTSNTCTPLCATGCNGGKCIAPNVCQCDAPMSLDEHNNTCIQPTCDPSCYKSHCKANKCECFPNHTPYNSTHCKPNCEEGYQTDENLNCIPTCEQNCDHGKCVGPNECDCDKGYSLQDDVCVFNCEPKCVNSVCVDVNTCQCNDGFVMTNVSYKCGPRIPPQGTPRCSTGFRLLNGECSPICENTCVNGECVAPNTCKCNEGFEFESDSSRHCIEPCSQVCRGFCDGHGNCYSDNDCTKMIIITNRCNDCREANLECCKGWIYNMKTKSCSPRCSDGCKDGNCIAPNTCVCDPPRSFYKGACVLPKCEKDCFNGQCVGINRCECNRYTKPINETHCEPYCPEGYASSPVTLKCEPVCQTCKNGACIAPDTCKCNEGYKKDEDGICQPYCYPKCVNSKCHDGNICKCFNGFVKTRDSWQCEPLCEGCENGVCISPNNCTCNEGYQRYDNSCRPICNPECVHSNCIGPNICECHTGYKKNNLNECIPFCKNFCVNSTCVSPDLCKCIEGYEKTEIDFICKPLCKPECENSMCVAPNTCNCNQGYRRILGNPRKCEPLCEGCENGVCRSPNDCKCNEVYQRYGNSCRPICNPECKNGECIQPNSCQCYTGYEKNGNQNNCQPICEPECDNGICLAPNNCSCNEGYKTIDSKWKCEAICENCDNGTCVAPNNCTCFKGYERSNNTCNPVCKPNCEFGSCIAPNTCQCFTGYEKSKDMNVCLRKCEDFCQNGSCVNGECICEAGYQFNKDTCELISKTSECSNDSCLCEDGQPCTPQEAEQSSYTKIATLGISWAVGGAVLVILLIIVFVTIHRLSKKGKDRKLESCNETIPFGSIVYTAPGTLINPNPDIENKIDNLLGDRYDIEEDT